MAKKTWFSMEKWDFARGVSNGGRGRILTPVPENSLTYVTSFEGKSASKTSSKTYGAYPPKPL